ncbi:uncharacterized protein O3C94_013713 [Discoglossus pictus]
MPRVRSYATIEKECLGVVWALKKLQPYFFGNEFVVVIDHKPLSWLSMVSGDNGHLLRWTLLYDTGRMTNAPYTGDPNAWQDSQWQQGHKQKKDQSQYDPQGHEQMRGKSILAFLQQGIKWITGDDTPNPMSYQAQKELQMHRSVQASKQMLYDGVAIAIGMIEELEGLRHENRNTMRISDYPKLGAPVFHARNEPEAYSRIHASLTTLRVQLMCAVKESAEEAKPEVMKAILKWLGTRERFNINISLVDYCAVNILEILIYGNFRMPEEFTNKRKKQLPLCEEMISDTLTWIGKGRVFSEMQDKDFQENGMKKAVLANIRNEGHVHVGALRACNINPDLKNVFEQHNIPAESYK